MMAKLNGNGNLAKWIGILFAFLMAIAGWGYNIVIQGAKLESKIELQDQRLNTNCAEDAKVHPLVNDNKVKLGLIEDRQIRIQQDIAAQNQELKEISRKQDIIIRRSNNP